jgi:hypothetical protein
VSRTLIALLLLHGKMPFWPASTKRNPLGGLCIQEYYKLLTSSMNKMFSRILPDFPMHRSVRAPFSAAQQASRIRQNNQC